ncbi:nickel transporter [Rahnella sp. Lac-M11]|jgi:hypothetical protein|uniref:Nickel transporter n=2 Tax=Rahnella TaxID=34037 RepID=A0A6M2AZ18_9GAMM|nr:MULTISPECIES: nickel transporter [Rahnella]KAB8308945.1 nickel transporter [Rouxiella chamberiensis]MCS3421463.1 hypothetical protein [Rahnella sp. BIGb0603]MDF1893846.1 nickel transporter [Rahnella contaminans]NGX85839.1 nickel transporter [Rahnella contaminans]
MSEDIEQKIENSISDIITLFNLENEENEYQFRLFKNHLVSELTNTLSLEFLKERLNVIYTYERNYLELLKEFKEEIKFAGTLQEDLRKERAKFFSGVLDEVSNTLKNSQVDDRVAASWIKELVSSYTKSLDVSEGLVDEGTLNSLGKIRDMAKEEKDTLDQ